MEIRNRIARVAWLLAGLGLPLSAWSQADDARARKIVGGVCFVCHGAEGESSSEMFPRLAGQHWEYTAKQLENFKSGKRKSSAMADMVARLSTDDMVALGKFFEKQSVPPQPARDKVLAAAGQLLYHGGNTSAGLPACASCHGPDARGSATLPRLAGQLAAYTEHQLKSFRQRERTNDNAVMHSIASRLSPQEMAALAEYLSSK